MIIDWNLRILGENSTNSIYISLLIVLPASSKQRNLGPRGCKLQE